jgi:hypothetical protein
LDNLHPFLVFGLHVGHDSLIHGDHLVERSLDSGLLSLQELDLVFELCIFSLQLSAPAVLLLMLPKVVSFSEKNVVC